MGPCSGGAVELGLSLVGQAAKRGITHRIPKGGALVASALERLGAEPTDLLRRAARTPDVDGRAGLRCSLHPSAPDLVLTADDAGVVTLEADTAVVGPGYHTYVRRLAERLGEELDVAWSQGLTPGAPGVATPGAPGAGVAVFAASDRPAAERAHLAWLRRRLVRAAESRRTGSPAVHLGTPDGVRYQVRGALATVLGPRSDEWLARAMADPRVAIDVWPWFADAMDGRYHLNRAACLAWTEVRWRPPADASERALLMETLGHLRRAHLLDPDLDMPWLDWLELIDLAGGPEPLRPTVAAWAAAADPTTPRIGYRREPVTVLHEGWRVEVPGAFAERRSSQRWWGGDGGRSISLSPVVAVHGGRPAPPEVVLESMAGDLGPEALDHRAGDIVGRARMRTDDASGVSLGVVEGFVAIAGRGAAIRVEFDDPAEWQWALDRWRALRPA